MTACGCVIDLCGCALVVTVGGLATTDEMCYAYLSYYPAHVTLRTCTSVALLGLRQVCDNVGGTLPPTFQPMPYEQLPVVCPVCFVLLQFSPYTFHFQVNPCLDYEKPTLDRVPQPLFSFDPSIYDHVAQMDSAGDYILYWVWDAENDVIHFAADVKTPGISSVHFCKIFLMISLHFSHTCIVFAEE